MPPIDGWEADARLVRSCGRRSPRSRSSAGSKRCCSPAARRSASPGRPEASIPHCAPLRFSARARAFDIAHEQIDHWLVHPGGRRIIENVQSALDLSNEQTAISWQALADHGNIGTPSIFYVLDETIRSREPATGERGLMVTIGPGVTLGLMLLGW